ncbi:Na+/H+ antiporter NhaA [Gluconacetobacter azotocaptans]|uniref:Na(+)/H(+) antiporter NhaA n=1 Tax=Gluconacetobacter azotocaptans TaxID=142834 RepID=A0A7W4JSI4_9PROT|nr:Na+/H+ antiporter NhaA [Gluconacetobacter azotocaptans]
MPERKLPRVRIIAERTFAALEHFLHIEAVSGAVLLAAAAFALAWANSAMADSYHHLWQLSFAIRLGGFIFDHPLHFWINDVLMTVFFLVVGMEIRREVHEGALTDLRQALLPVAAALGGVLVPALLYLGLNGAGPQRQGWAVPTATDIAFAVGVLALLGKSIPGNIRIFLLALAIIDDIVAVLIIAFFYSSGLHYGGFAVAGLGVVMVSSLHIIGIGSAYAYVLPGAVIWAGLLMTGVHPTLAGVVLGLMTPVMPMRASKNPLDTQREMLPPVVRVQAALHPWVAYGVMPLFALANAGVTVDGVDLSRSGPQWVMAGVAIALVAGKFSGIVSVSWLTVRLGFCRLPPGVDWGGVCLIGLLGGIGFTMSIFIAMLAFEDANLLGAAKLGVLAGSVIATASGLGWGTIYVRGRRRQA